MAMQRGPLMGQLRRDRILLPQQHGHPPGPGMPPLHPGHFNRPPPNRFEEEDEFGRILPHPAMGWEGHQHQQHQQQQAMAGVMLRRRVNPQHMQQHHHLPPPPLLHQQQPCGVQPQEWDGGPPHPPVEILRLRQPGGMVVGREMVEGDFLAGLRHREEMGDLRNSEHLKLASRASHEKMIAESEYLRIASRASHEKLIERDHQLKNAYRASHEKLIAEKELLKKVSRAPGPHGKPPPMDNERPLVADMARPFHALQVMEPPPPNRNHVGPFGSWEENAHSGHNLVMRYGTRPPPPPRPQPAQELSADASIPPGFQSVIMSCKRPRDDDKDFERSRLQQRPRRPPLGVDNIPPGIPHPRPLQRAKEELVEAKPLVQQQQQQFGSYRSSGGVHADDEHEEGQVTPPQGPTIPVYRAEPIGPPGFYKPELEAASRHLSSLESATTIATRGSSQPEAIVSESACAGPHFQDLASIPAITDSVPLLRPKSSTSRPSTASGRAVGNDSGPSAVHSSSRAVGNDSGPTSRPSTARSGGGDGGQISRPSTAARVALGIDSPTRRSLPLSPSPLPLPPPPSTRTLVVSESPTRRPSTSRAVGIDTGPSTSRPSTARALGSPTLRPSTVRTVGINSVLASNQHDRGGGSFKGEILVPKGERASPTPLRKDSEQISTRQERKRVSGSGEGNASLTSEVSNVRRRVGKDSDSRSRHVEAIAVERVERLERLERLERSERVERFERDYDNEHRKRPRQEDDESKDIRPYSSSSSSRKTRIVPDPDRRPSKGSRWDDALKLKSARQSTTTIKEGREGREMTIFVHKHGQRTVKVEESKSARGSFSRLPIYIHSRHERGGLRDGLESNNKDIERLSENRSKESEHLLSLAGQDKGLGSQATKEACISRHSIKEASTPRPALGSSQERLALLASHQIKKEIIPLSDKAEPEPPQRPAILSRLTTPKPDSLPTKTRLRSEMLRQEKIVVSHANSKALLPSVSSKKSSPDPTQNIGGKVKPDRLVEGTTTHRSVSKQVASLGDVEEKITLTSTSLRVLSSGKVAGKVQATREELNSQLSARLLKLQIPDGSKGEEEAVQTRYPSISISPNGIKNVYSPLQIGPDGLQRDSRLVESRNLHKSDALQLRLEGPSLPTVDLLAPASSAMIATDASIEVNEQSPGCRPTPAPKLIFTGHKSDQSFKETSPHADISLKEYPGLTVPRISDVKTTDKSDNRKSIVPVLPKVSCDTTRRAELTEARNWTSQYIVACDAGPASPQQNLLENKLRWSSGKHAETLRKPNTGPGSLSTSLPTSVQPVKSLRDLSGRVEISQAIALSTDVSGVSEKEEEARSFKPPSVLQAHQEEKGDLAVVPTPAPPTLSTPKEVRLFGANLIAPVPVPVVERVVESLPKIMEVVKPVEPESVKPVEPSPVSVSAGEVPVMPPQITEVPEVVVNVPPETVGCVGIEESVPANDLAESKEQSLSLSSHEDQQAAEPIIPDISEVQAQSNEPPLQEKQVVTVSTLPKGGSESKDPRGIARDQRSTRMAGAHMTWLRSVAGNSSATPASSVPGFRSTSSGIGGISQPAVRSVPGTMGAAYVRKGNSLVRAPGPVRPTGTLGQITVSGTQKPPISRNPSFPGYEIVKSSQPALRKSVCPTSESAGLVSPVFRSLTIPSGGPPQGNTGSISESGISSGRPKTPPQGALGAGSSGKSGLVLSASTLVQSGTGSRLQTSIGDDVGDNLAEASICSPGSKTLPVVIPSNSGNPVPGPNNMVYVRRKANQLVVAPCPQAVDLSLAENQGVNKQPMPDLYIKRKTNQLVRNCGLKGNGNSSFVQAILGNGPPKDLTEEGSRNSVLYKKMRLGRVLRQKKGLTGRSSWVWTLSGGTVSHDSDTTGHVRRPAPLLFPWKRHSLTTSIRSRRVRTLPEGKKGSLLFVMSERLRRVRPVQPVYTRSADGFSLHRSGVLSVGGGNLKWTKSLEKRAKLASEAATKAVAAAESRKRKKKEAVVEAVVKAKSDRRVTRKAAKGAGERIVWVGLVRYRMDAASKTLQRIPDTKGDSGTAISSGPAKTLPLLTPRRSYIGGTVYLRVGNGNQLVRDPKAASQALASEKVRWSLHHARSRGAKRQQYCQFFTRFGKCNKENGKCIYIHDPDKVAVCTKFLKGNCTDEQCLLTHKVIPERMPDCSFFLEGLCTNERCPYRHVNVNPKAPYCDGFLRGYCKDGDKCNKKHTYVCPTHAATGECADQASCKFHHPKKKGKVETAITRKLGTKRKRRYFCSTESETGEKLVRNESSAASSVAEEEKPVLSLVEDDKVVSEDLEFISLANAEEHDGEAKVSPEAQKPWSFTPGVPSFIRKGTVEAESGSAEEVERWIKPTFLFKVTSPAAS